MSLLATGSLAGDYVNSNAESFEIEEVCVSPPPCKNKKSCLITGIKCRPYQRCSNQGLKSSCRKVLTWSGNSDIFFEKQICVCIRYQGYPS